MTTPFKTCTICGEVKPVTEFYKRRRNEYVYHSECKACKHIARTQGHAK